MIKILSTGFFKLKILTSILLFSLLPTSVFAQTAEEIAAAISEGNCAFLYDFIQETEGKEKKLIDNAKNTIARYTRTDSAAAKYRTNKMEARVRNAGRELTENVFLDPESDLPQLVNKLVSGLTDTFLKAKVIHDFICYNIDYDTDHYFGKAYSQQDYISVLKNKKAVCSGYTNLFNQMCRLASITSIGISGFSKGAGYRGEIGNYPDHFFIPICLQTINTNSMRRLLQKNNSWKNLT